MSNYIPLISSGTAGPLDVLQLPRFWQKVSLEAAGKLNPEYPACGGGFDSMLLKGLGLDQGKTLNYIKTSKPTYTQFEAWIKVQPGVILDNDAIAELNDSIRDYDHSDEDRQKILKLCNLPDDENAPHDAISLNDLEDWALWHAELAAA